MSNCSCNSPLRARRGITFAYSWRWAADPLVYKAVVAVTSLTPLTLTVTAHGVIDGQSVAFAELEGLDSVNASSSPPAGSDFHAASVDDANTLHFTDIDAARDDQSYSGGGKIAYYTLVDLSAFASAQLLIYALSNADTPVLTVNAVLDNTAKTISVSSNLPGLTEDEYTFVLTATSNSGPISFLRSGTLVIAAAGAVGA